MVSLCHICEEELVERINILLASRFFFFFKLCACGRGTVCGENSSGVVVVIMTAEGKKWLHFLSAVCNRIVPHRKLLFISYLLSALSLQVLIYLGSDTVVKEFTF